MRDDGAGYREFFERLADLVAAHSKPWKPRIESVEIGNYIDMQVDVLLSFNAAAPPDEIAYRTLHYTLESERGQITVEGEPASLARSQRIDRNVGNYSLRVNAGERGQVWLTDVSFYGLETKSDPVAFLAGNNVAPEKPRVTVVGYEPVL